MCGRYSTVQKFDLITSGLAKTPAAVFSTIDCPTVEGLLFGKILICLYYVEQKSVNVRNTGCYMELFSKKVGRIKKM